MHAEGARAADGTKSDLFSRKNVRGVISGESEGGILTRGRPSGWAAASSSISTSGRDRARRATRLLVLPWNEQDQNRHPHPKNSKHERKGEQTNASFALPTPILSTRSNSKPSKACLAQPGGIGDDDGQPADVEGELEDVPGRAWEGGYYCCWSLGCVRVRGEDSVVKRGG